MFLTKGPNYSQLINYDLDYTQDTILYTLKTSMKLGSQLSGFGQNPSQIQVCKIIITANQGLTTIAQEIVTADRLSTSQYQAISKDYDLGLLLQQSRSSVPAFIPGPKGYSMEEEANSVNDIEFRIQWLGTWELYVDFIELQYDDYIWRTFEIQGISNITTQVNNFQNFNNIHYWYTKDEPEVDRFEPHHLVNNAVIENSNNAAITTYLPYANGTYNDIYIPQFLSKAQPSKFMFDIYPIRYDVNYIEDPGYTNFLLQEFEKLRTVCNAANTLSPGYYFVGQGFYSTVDGEPNQRMLTTEEFNSQNMLALSHGARGLIIWKYKSDAHFPSLDSAPNLKIAFSNLATRLKGSLGNTLLDLNHNSSEYIRVYWAPNGPNQNSASFSNYLTIEKLTSDPKTRGSYHCGVFYDPTDVTDNKYFFLVNELTLNEHSQSIKVKVNRPNQNYVNWRWRNVEGGFDTTISISSVTERTFTMPLGQGYLHQLSPVVKYGGKIRYNETISGTNTLSGEMTVESGATLTINGTYTINQNITINSGGNLVINPGAILRFASAKSLIVNGTIYAIGSSSQRITFTSQSGTIPNSWGYIKLNGSGSSGSQLRYANVQYCTRVLVTNVSNVTIQDCNITNTEDGINLIGSTGNIFANNISTSSTGHGIIIQSGSTVTCERNIITKTGTNKTGVGIFYFQSSGGTLWQNDISGWMWGVGAFNSSPQFRKNPAVSQSKNNRIKNCTYGVTAYQNSWPVVGAASTGYGYNSISIAYNTKNVYFTSGGELLALTNYWGGTPIPSMFYLGLGCTINTGGYLLGDPWQQEQLAGNNTINISKESIFYGIELLGQDKLFEAKDFFTSYINKHAGEQPAYVYLYNCYSKETAVDLIKFFNNLPPEAAKENKMLLSYLYLKQGDVEMAKKTNNTITEENPGTALSNTAKLSNVYIALFYDNDLEAAISIYNDVLSKSNLTTSIELSLAQSAIESYASTYGGTVDKLFLPKVNTTVSNAELPVSYDLLGNYPNPFNPTTKISYQLPIAAQVTLKVYDLLGREVATLVNEEKQAGNYGVEFDASNLSSVVYFYRISINDFVKTMKMIVIK
jgi:hypothetical protein